MEPVRTGPKPRPVFKVVAFTEEEENAFDYVKDRQNPHPTGVLGATAHMVKGALGGGILGGHVAYVKAGVWMGLVLNLFFGVYMAYCLHLLVWSAQQLYKRTRISTMTYPDVGEAAFACHPNRIVKKMSRCFRYIIDIIICIDLYGACACYQLIISKSIKQLVENTQLTSMEGLGENYPHLRIYLAAMIVPIILICLIRYLKYLAPFSLGANAVVFTALCTAVYYAVKNNPSFLGLTGVTTFWETLEFVGMIVFSMSCAGVVIPIENNMADPKKFPISLVIGMSIIVFGTAFVSFFGYTAYLEYSEAPITVNFPMTVYGKVLKGLIAIMIYVTHAVNFWPPFQICYYYISRCVNQNRIVFWEYIWRAIFVALVGALAIGFPSINALMGFLGTFCLTNMAFIWPLLIHLCVIWERPGLGKYYWRLWRCVGMMSVAIFIFFCGTVVNASELVAVFKGEL
ncbi:hypothetical protein ABMA28_010532 [Loxostege sticticalis]|uniref:Amino acid transporter transmembrane domain-containing protein n=1 Tax=Loxostege sticticalis TaxID=481309 RepID=A0ABD0S9C3_LOXSC